MSPPKSLNARVPWLWLLSQLEVVVPSSVLPATFLPCPLCRHSQLSIMEDYLNGGETFHCRNCNESGDMIELAAKAWGLSIAGTIIKLARSGFDLPTDSDTIRGYLASHVDYRKRLGQLWKDSQSYLCQHRLALRPLFSDLGLPDEFSQERWNAGPAKVLGGNLCRSVEEAILPGSVLCCGNEQIPRCRSARRVFRGGRWGKTLVIPFFSAPERICAFGFIGRQGDMTKDYVFRLANLGRRANGLSPEAGLAMHPQTQEIAADWGKCVFAVSDPLLYLDLHLRQFGYSNDPIPLVLWQDAPATTTAHTQHAWWMFRDRKIIFWDPTFPIPMLQQAMAIDGWIAMVGPRNCDATSPREYASRHMPSTICQRLQRNAKPWPDALAFAMLHWADSQIEDFFLQLQINAPQLDRVRRACRPGLRGRLDRITRPHNIGNTVPVDGGVVVAKDGCWYFYRNSDRQRQLTQICNAQIRLEHVVTCPKPGCTVYSGTIRSQGETIPFAAPRRAFEANPFRWLDQHLASQHKGPLHYAKRWSQNVINIAAQFHQPALLPGISTVGWDAKRLHFAIPGYRIGVDGVETVPDPDMPMPGVGLVLQESITDAWDDYDDYGAALYWATLGCILDNVLAPALLRDPHGIGLLGDGAQAVGRQVAEAAGCAMQVIRGPGQLRRALQVEQLHHWPIYGQLPPSKNGSKVRDWYTQNYPRNCISPVRVCQPGWWTVAGEEPAKVRTRLLTLTKRIVPAYLRDVCERRLRVEDVHDDLAGFIARQGGTMDLDRVRSVLRW